MRKSVYRMNIYEILIIFERTYLEIKCLEWFDYQLLLFF